MGDYSRMGTYTRMGAKSRTYGIPNNAIIFLKYMDLSVSLIFLAHNLGFSRFFLTLFMKMRGL